MKVLRASILILLLFGFNSGVKAQFCVWGIRTDVRDNTGKIIENAVVELTALDKERTMPQHFRDGNFHGWSEWGSKIRSAEFLLKVSAEGYKNFEQKINFPFCYIQGYEVKLKSKDSNSKVNFEMLSEIFGQVTDENGKPIGNVEIKAETADGRVYKTKSTNAGFYGLYLPKGNIKIQFLSDKFTEPIFNNLEVEAENHTGFVTKICLQYKQKTQK